MDDDNTKDTVFHITSTPSGEDLYYEEFRKLLKQQLALLVDLNWDDGSGMTRGTVTKREDNVVHVRFKDAGGDNER